MSPHWRLAFQYAMWVSIGAVLVGVVVWFLYGGPYAGAFLYGVGVGIVSFVSTALTVSLLTGQSKTFGVLIVAISFMVRYGFVACALGVPAYLGLWPVLAMLGGFAGVYLSENVVLLPGVLSSTSMKRETGRSVSERVERRVEA
jgi:hypothetical protein